MVTRGCRRLPPSQGWWKGLGILTRGLGSSCLGLLGRVGSGGVQAPAQTVVDTDGDGQRAVPHGAVLCPVEEAGAVGAAARRMHAGALGAAQPPEGRSAHCCFF